MISRKNLLQNNIILIVLLVFTASQPQSNAPTEETTPSENHLHSQLSDQFLMKIMVQLDMGSCRQAIEKNPEVGFRHRGDRKSPLFRGSHLHHEQLIADA